MFRSIKSKFILFSLIIIALGVGFPTYFLLLQLEKNFYQRSEIMLKTTLDVFRNGLESAMMIGKSKDIQQIIENLAAIESISNIRMMTLNGDIKYSNHIQEVGIPIDSISNHKFIIHEKEPVTIEMIDNEELYCVFEPIINLPKCQQCHNKQKSVLAYLDIDTELTNAEVYFHTGSIHIIFLAIVMICILSIGFYLLFNTYINKPLRQFMDAFKSMEEGNLSIQLPAKKNDEIGILERRFNIMSSKLDSSQKQIEKYHFEQLERADKLITIGEIATQMAHEINNPIGITYSRLEYLNLECDQNPEFTKYKSDIDVIINQLQKVSSITKNILKYSKKLPKDFSDIELVKIINDSIFLLEPRLNKNNITITRDFKIDHANITGDAQQIEQVMINLINNSIDAMPEGGNIKIEVMRNNTDHIEVIISDNGSGINEQDRDDIFTPFFTTKSGEKGTGLGLYIVKNILKNHNAEITCQSKINEGTTFTITF